MPDSPEQLEFFEKKIRPILSEHCYSCHSADTKPSGGLRVDDRNGILVGGNTGASVVVGDPEKSLLLERILTTNEKKHMPKEGDDLSETEIADLKTWIKDGLAWPRERIPVNIGKTRPDYEKLKAEHWAWQPLQNSVAPEVTDKTWPQSDLDRFVLAKLEEKKLPPFADADAITLIRRVTFDLTGLPPTPAEVEAFVKDSSTEALAKVVDRLLESQSFGERWGRHWLDVARYGESTGPSRNIPYPHAWKFRDMCWMPFSAMSPLIASFRNRSRVISFLPMQDKVPALLDISKEPEKVREAYGITDGPKGSFARQCLMARRLSEAGVRFVEICQPGWDHHNNLHNGLIERTGNVDKPQRRCSLIWKNAAC